MLKYLGENVLMSPIYFEMHQKMYSAHNVTEHTKMVMLGVSYHDLL